MIHIQSQNKRSWVEINLSQLIKNYHVYTSLCSKQTRIIAVVKANAYNHGDIMVAKCLQEKGVSLFAVSNLDEAISLRQAGIHGEILILGYTPLETIDLLQKYDITQTLLSMEYAEAFAMKAGKSVKCQFAINTGMNRIGLNCYDIEQCEEIIRCYAKTLQLNGLYTHLCAVGSAEESDVAFTRKQMQTFEALATRLDDLKLEYVHCMNSAGGLTLSSKYDKFIRLGILLYGLKPGDDWKMPEGIEPVLEWKSVVSRVETVEPGETIGYGRSFCAKKQMRVATIPTGYADGYSRALSNKGYVLIHGQRAPIVGRICMDQMMVDVTNIEKVSFEDEVVLIGRSGVEQITADMLAATLNTIGYEVICNISARVKRVYL